MTNATPPAVAGTRFPRRRDRATLCAAALIAALALPAPVRGHGDVMRIGSAQAGGGQLRIESEFDFDLDVVVPPTTQVGGLTLHSTIFPSFTWIGAARPDIHPLSESVTVRLMVAAPINDGASLRLDGRTLDDPGEAATIGTFEPDAEAHVHPEWQLILPNGVTGEYQISFVLTTTAPGYSQSPLYTLVLTNVAPAATATPSATSAAIPSATAMPSGTPEETPAATATPSAAATETATAAPPTCRGDCDGNGSVTIAELIRAAGLALANEVEGCAAADANGDGRIGVEELVRAVRSALDGCA